MTNEEAIKSMRNLDDIISITESEHESVKTAISALEHNSLLIEHISSLQNENTDFFNKLIESEQENANLKAEIELLSDRLISFSVENEVLKKKNELVSHSFELYSDLLDENEQLKEELAKLKPSEPKHKPQKFFRFKDGEHKDVDVTMRAYNR